MFKKAICVKVYTTSPKKPNSAVRKVTKVSIKKSKLDRASLIAYIPGEGHDLQKYSIVLVRPGKIKDLPGVKHRLVPGKYDFKHHILRKRKRSKYGVKKQSQK